MDRQSRVSLAKLYNINLEIWDVQSYQEADGSITYMVEVRATDENGRLVSSLGVCNTKEMEPSERLHHDTATVAETRAKNRAIAEILDIEVEPPEEKSDTEEKTEPITANQIKLLHTIARTNGWEDMLHEHIKQKWGISSTKELTRQQAKEVIDYLKKEQYLQGIEIMNQSLKN